MDAIGEEVATIYPELVVRVSKGWIDSLRYDELASILLNEVQQGQKKRLHDLEQAGLARRNRPADQVATRRLLGAQARAERLGHPVLASPYARPCQ